jgi:hypothetical protein
MEWLIPWPYKGHFYQNGRWLIAPTVGLFRPADRLFCISAIST